jgi:hypothetical protein
VRADTLSQSNHGPVLPHVTLCGMGLFVCTTVVGSLVSPHLIEAVVVMACVYRSGMVVGHVVRHCGAARGRGHRHRHRART